MQKIWDEIDTSQIPEPVSLVACNTQTYESTVKYVEEVWQIPSGAISVRPCGSRRLPRSTRITTSRTLVTSLFVFLIKSVYVLLSLVFINLSADHFQARFRRLDLLF